MIIWNISPFKRGSLFSFPEAEISITLMMSMHICTVYEEKMCSYDAKPGKNLVIKHD